MPITFTPKYSTPTLQYTAASISELVSNIDAKRLVVTVVYGDIVTGQFIRNVSIPHKFHVIDGANFATAAGKLANGTKSVYDNLKEAIWSKLFELGLESGTIT